MEAFRSPLHFCIFCITCIGGAGFTRKGEIVAEDGAGLRMYFFIEWLGLLVGAATPHLLKE